MKIGKEGKRKLKASLANTALFLSVFVVLFPLILPIVKAEGDPRTIYVDDIPGDEGEGNPPENWTSIGEAIQDANPRDIIFVYGGTYNETVIVNKDCLNITGESRDNTTIDAKGTGTVITISASWVNVTGFTVKNGNGPDDNGVVINSCNNVTIYGNNIKNNNWSSIYLYSSQHCKIVNNDISSSYWGICLWKSNHSQIDNNIINDARNEEITDYHEPPSCIFLLSSYENSIYDNSLINNSECGIHIENSNSNYINNSYITNNSFGIRLDNSNYNTIHQNNQILNNTIDGIYLNGSSGSHNNTINGNIISNNNNIGINISNSNDNVICNNDILSNSIYGISLHNSKDNHIFNNTANENTIYGLYIEGDYRNNISENNTFNGGNISYVCCVNGTPSQLNNSIQNKVLTSGTNVTNVGKISFVECSYFNALNNIISNNTWGIFLYNSNNITLDNNNISVDSDTGYGIYIEGDYRNNITNTTTVNGEKIYYYYNFHGSKSNPIIVEIPQTEQPLDEKKVINTGKVSVVDCSYLEIKNNNVSNGYYGIFLYGSQNLTLWNNTIMDSEDVGLYITGGYHHYIPTNNSVKGYQGVWENISYYTDIQDEVIENFSLTARNITNVGKLTFINCTNIIIVNNTLSSAIWDHNQGKLVGGDGIFLYNSNENIIMNNTLGENIHGIHLIKSNDNIVSNCKVRYKDGILIEHSNNNNISNSTFTIGGLGILTHGVVVSDSGNITIHNNTMKPHGTGIYGIGVSVSESHNIIITNNTFNETARHGISGSDAVLLIENNSFYRSGSGRMIYLRYCDNRTKINNNTIIFKYPPEIVSGSVGLTVSIFLDHSSPIIENITSIHPYIPPSIPRLNANNHANIGHISVYLNSSPVIKNSYFHGSSWGISLMGNATPEIKGNEINGTDIGINVASSDLPGADVKNTTSYADIVGNYINYTHSWGNECSPKLKHWGIHSG